MKSNTWHGSNAAEAVGNVSIVLFTSGEDISPTLAIKNVENTQLVVTGYTETNGVQMIEAVERTDKTFAVGLQFHPEAALVKYLDDAANKYDYTGYETALSIFRYIVDRSCLTLGSWRISAEPRTALVDYVAAITDEWGAE